MTTLPNGPGVAAHVRAILDQHWQPEGFTVPNGVVYPHQWLWDSCFHAVIWTHLGEPERAVSELTAALAHQSDDGFVPHLTYWNDPGRHAEFWGQPKVSSITQPPMYGHALAQLARAGHPPPQQLVEAGVAGLAHLADRRVLAGDSGLVAVVHPWETGCDDAPRWDSWCPGGFTPQRWRVRKGELVASLVRRPGTLAPSANPDFQVGSIGFNALVGFNALELATVVTDDREAGWLRGLADDLRAAISRRWDDELGCAHDWADPYRPSCGARTLDAVLDALLESRRDSRLARVQLLAVTSDAAFGGDCGPAAVHRREPAYDPTTYWRGPAWPQLSYLCWVAAIRLGHDDLAATLAECLVRGATRSGFAEYWHPDTGTAGGAAPQSWAGLAAVVAASAER